MTEIFVDFDVKHQYNSLIYLQIFEFDSKDYIFFLNISVFMLSLKYEVIILTRITDFKSSTDVSVFNTTGVTRENITKHDKIKKEII